jgi:long-chain fatty acid transport protein
MSGRRVKSLLLACSGIGALFAATVDANAGSFALREQSAYGQGSSFAGIAAGGALSSMYWNPAAITQFDGKAFESDITGIIPNVSHSYSNSSLASGPLGTLIPGYRNGVDNSGNAALLPAMYVSWQLNPQLWAGLSINSPFGSSVNFPQIWAGAGYGQNTDIKTYNVAPTLAYKINDMISVAVGVQVQYMTVAYAVAAPGFPTGNMASISGNGYSYGYTLGATITPTPTTKIGIGYRSALNQKIDGDLTTTGIPGSSAGGVNVGLNLPGILTVGLRQGIGDRFTLLAGVEWTNWSRIGTANLLTSAGAPATIGPTAVTFPFQYSDGWFYSLGGEYVVDPTLKLRAGIAFEKSPITDGVRTPRLPDNDRMWYSVGASYKVPQFRGVTADLGYSFINTKDTPLNLGPGSGNPWSNGTGFYVGSVSSHTSIFSLAVRYQWDDAAPAPMHQRYTK